MSPRFVQRAVWLVGVCFVAVIAAVALTRRNGDSDKSLPGAVPVPGTQNGYYTGRAAPYSPSAAHPRTACGERFTDKTQGVAHPVLPCGVRLYIRFRGNEVLTQVIDRGPTVPGRDFDVTKALANQLGLHGAQTIQWRFAKPTLLCDCPILFVARAFQRRTNTTAEGACVRRGEQPTPAGHPPGTPGSQRARVTAGWGATVTP